MNSQNTHMQFKLNNALLETNISTYGDLFVPLSAIEALKSGVSSVYNYKYVGDDIFFCGYKAHNIALKVLDGKILSVHFELENNSKEILQNLLHKLGYPESGRISPNVPRLRDPNGSKTAPSNILYENFNALNWATDDNYHYLSISNIVTPQYFSLNNPNLWISFSISQRFLKYKKIESQDSVKIYKNVSFEKQKQLFETLGYYFNQDISIHKIIIYLMGDVLEPPEVFVEKQPDSKLTDYFEAFPAVRLYYFYGWTFWNNREKVLTPFTNQCIWFDVCFLKVDKDYEYFIKRMDLITNGELKISDIEIDTLNENEKKITFLMADNKVEWVVKLDDLFNTFVKRFSELPQKIKSISNYTFYKHHPTQFVIDYATPSEQKEFIKKTGLQRSWLLNQ